MSPAPTVQLGESRRQVAGDGAYAITDRDDHREREDAEAELIGQAREVAEARLGRVHELPLMLLHLRDRLEDGGTDLLCQ